MIPPGPELVAHNRHIFAVRFNWPAGAEEACAQIDADNPGWMSSWRTGPRFVTGYYASHQHHQHLEPEMYGETPDELHAAIRAHRCDR